MGHLEADGSAVPPFSIEPHFRPSVPGKTEPQKFHGSPRTTRPRNNPSNEGESVKVTIVTGQLSERMREEGNGKRH